MSALELLRQQSVPVEAAYLARQLGVPLEKVYLELVAAESAGLASVIVQYSGRAKQFIGWAAEG